MRQFLLLVFIVACNILNAQVPSGYNLVWSDEFDYETQELDKNWNWEEGIVNSLLSARIRENAITENGVLKLQNKIEDCTDEGGFVKNYTSANGWTTRTFKYGYFESRIKYSAAEGINNSFWLITKNIPQGAAKGFEIDINEGHYKTANDDEINTNLHTWDSSLPRDTQTNNINNSEKFYQSQDLSSDFHTYALEWTETKLNYYFDGTLIRTIDFADIEGLVTGVTVPVFVTTAVLDWLNPTPAVDGTSMEVDYVRVYQKDGVKPDENLMIWNSGFDSGLDNWEFSVKTGNTSTYEIEEVNGNKVLKFNASAGSKGYDVSFKQTFPLEEGTYDLSFKVKSDAAASLVLKIANDVTGASQLDQTYQTTTEWQTYVLKNQAYSMDWETKLTFWIGDQDETFYFDDIQLTKVDSKDLSEGGSIEIDLAGFSTKSGSIDIPLLNPTTADAHLQYAPTVEPAKDYNNRIIQSLGVVPEGTYELEFDIRGDSPSPNSKTGLPDFQVLLLETGSSTMVDGFKHSSVAPSVTWDKHFVNFHNPAEQEVDIEIRYSNMCNIDIKSIVLTKQMNIIPCGLHSNGEINTPLYVGYGGFERETSSRYIFGSSMFQARPSITSAGFPDLTEGNSIVNYSVQATDYENWGDKIQPIQEDGAARIEIKAYDAPANPYLLSMSSPLFTDVLDGESLAGKSVRFSFYAKAEINATYTQAPVVKIEVMYTGSGDERISHYFDGEDLPELTDEWQLYHFDHQLSETIPQISYNGSVTSSAMWCRFNFQSTGLFYLDYMQMRRLDGMNSIALNQYSLNLSLNETATLHAIVDATDGINTAVKWESSDTNIASVDQYGLVSAGSSAGTVTITATSEYGGLKVSCEVNVGTATATDSTIESNKVEVWGSKGRMVINANETCELEVYSITGAKVYRGKVQSGRTEINNLNSNQIYIAKIIVNGKVFTRKIKL